MIAAHEEMEDLLGDWIHGVIGEVGAKDNCKPLSLDAGEDGSTMARMKAVRGKKNLRNFRHISWKCLHEV